MNKEKFDVIRKAKKKNGGALASIDAENGLLYGPERQELINIKINNDDEKDERKPRKKNFTSPLSALLHMKFMQQREEMQSADSRMAKKGSTLHLFDVLLDRKRGKPSMEDEFFMECEKYVEGYFKGMSQIESPSKFLDHSDDDRNCKTPMPKRTNSNHDLGMGLKMRKTSTQLSLKRRRSIVQNIKRSEKKDLGSIESFGTAVATDRRQIMDKVIDGLV